MQIDNRRSPPVHVVTLLEAVLKHVILSMASPLYETYLNSSAIHTRAITEVSGSFLCLPTFAVTGSGRMRGQVRGSHPVHAIFAGEFPSPCAHASNSRTSSL